MEQNSLSQQVYDLVQQYEAQYRGESEAALEKIKSQEQEIEALKTKLAQQQNRIQDDELQSRLEKLRTAPSDTLIREVGVILENRIRRLIGASANDAHGVQLIDLAFRKETGRFQASKHPGEQEGIHMLYRGALQFIRNPPMHKLIDYPETTTQIFIALIDSLLMLLSEISQPEKSDHSESDKETRWTPDKLEKVFQSLPNQKLANRLKAILHMAISIGAYVQSTSKYAAFGLKSKTGKRVITFDQNDGIYLSFLPDRYGTLEEREKALHNYKDLKLVDRHLQLADVNDGRYSQRRLSLLDDDEFTVFMKVIESICT